MARADLTPTERRALSAIDPRLMGGEYLPDKGEREVEIARVELMSTTHDVISVYARRHESLIRYRVVDEYEGDTLTEIPEHESADPLTLGELADFLLRAWSFMQVLESNFEDDVAQMLQFFRASSQFYPEFDELLRQRVIDAHPA